MGDLISKEESHGLSLVILSDGYLVAGNTFGYGVGTYNGFFAKFDFDANLIWSKAYGTDLAQLFYQVLQTQDGGFLAVGLVIHPRPDGGSPCLAVRTDADGELLWSKSTGSPTDAGPRWKQTMAASPSRAPGKLLRVRGAPF